MKEAASIKVAVRIRPLSNKELARGDETAITVNESEHQLNIDGKATFTFDHVFGSNTAQFSVYESCVKDFVEEIFDGYNATVLAYGQTGSGKTHTMGTGRVQTLSQEDLGIVPRAVQHIFDGIEARKRKAQDCGVLPPVFEVHVTFVELYNENFLDLLLDSKERASKISLHEDPVSKEMILSGVKKRAVKSPEELMNFLQSGAKKRTMGSTRMNSQSSRSHAIFSIYVKQERSSAGVGSEVLNAKFHLVDLAGSESIAKTGATGVRAQEGCSINKSLLMLGNAINALAEKKQVNFRDSKLTRFLKDSLGGNSRTLMIACASPSAHDVAETKKAMEYANRTKNIQNKAVSNVSKSPDSVKDLLQRIAELEKELMELKSEKNEKISKLSSTVEALKDALEENERKFLALKQSCTTEQAEESQIMLKDTGKRLENLKIALISRGNAVKSMFKGFKKSMLAKISCLLN